MISDRYIWLAWSSAFLLPWLAVYAACSQHRKTMWWASLLTMPFGLTEPLFVPSYWNPPSIFDLAQRTGFDIESLIFCFGIGGIGSVLYNLVSGYLLAPVPCVERRSPRHVIHKWALATPFVLPVPLFTSLESDLPRDRCDDLGCGGGDYLSTGFGVENVGGQRSICRVLRSVSARYGMVGARLY